MEDEERWALMTEINLKLAHQINRLIDVCMSQQQIINNLKTRIEKLEDVARTTENDNAAIEELERYKDFYERHTRDDWGDQYL